MSEKAPSEAEGESFERLSDGGEDAESAANREVSDLDDQPGASSSPGRRQAKGQRARTPVNQPARARGAARRARG